MSALRETVEAGGSGLLNTNRRIDALLVAVADLFRKLEALAAMDDPESSDEARAAAVATWADWASAAGIFEAASRLEALSPEKLDQFIESRERAKRSEPFISTDRSPRRRKVLVGGTKATTDQVVDRYGNPVGTDDGLVM